MSVLESEASDSVYVANYGRELHSADFALENLRSNVDDDEKSEWNDAEGEWKDIKNKSDWDKEWEDKLMERDRLLHWWCTRRLHRCLRKLRRQPNAGPFLQPIDRVGPVFEHHEMIANQVDLTTIGGRLDEGIYNDADGFVNPELFWADIAFCWDNCMQSCEYDQSIGACQMAAAMAKESEKFESEFWKELSRFERSVEEMPPTLGSVTAVADIATGAVQDLAYNAIEDGGIIVEGFVETVSSWWQGPDESPDPLKVSDEVKPWKQDRKIDLNPFLHGRPSLQDQFEHLFKMRFGCDKSAEFVEIEKNLTAAVGAALSKIDSVHPCFEKIDRMEQPATDVLDVTAWQLSDDWASKAERFSLEQRAVSLSHAARRCSSSRVRMSHNRTRQRARSTLPRLSVTSPKRNSRGAVCSVQKMLVETEAATLRALLAKESSSESDRSYPVSETALLALYTDHQSPLECQ